jgi:hypothetical protein
MIRVGGASPELRREASMATAWTSSAVAMDLAILGESPRKSCFQYHRRAILQRRRKAAAKPMR